MQLMRRFLRITALGSVLICLFLAFSSPAAAFQFLGEYTWNVHETMSEEGPVDKNYTMTVGLSKISSTYFQVQGRILIPPANTLFAIISGGGVLVGDDLLLTLHYSLIPTVDYATGQIHAQINKTTGGGTFYRIGEHFGPPSSFGTDFSSGDLTIVGKIPVLTTTLAPLNLLLNE
jgi:hypothetical protein